MDGTEIIWSLVQDNFEHARSHEDYRARTVNLTLTVGSILVASLAIEGFSEKSILIWQWSITFQALIGLCLIAVGVYGALLSYKHYERNRMHVKVAQELLAKLSESSPKLLPFNTVELFENFKNTHTWKAKRAEPIKLNWLWTGFPLLLAIFGLLLLLGSFTPTAG